MASCEIASRLDDNPHADERGLTDELTRVLTSKNSPLVVALQDNLNKAKARIDLTLRETTIRDEALIGADLGVVLRISTDDVQYRRSALFQAKRLQPEGDVFGPYCTYGLDNRARKQAEAMLSHNTAAFFVLYNPTLLATFQVADDADRLTAVARRLTAYVTAYHEQAKVRLRDNVPPFVIPDHDVSVLRLPFDPSDAISVLPSDFVLHARASALRATPLRRYTTSFTNFMVDEFIGGRVGDATEHGIDTAEGKDRKFKVRYSVGVDLRRGRFFTDEDLQPLFR